MVFFGKSRNLSSYTLANSTPPKIFLVRAHSSVHGSVYPTCLSDQTPDTILPLSSVPALGKLPPPTRE